MMHVNSVNAYHSEKPRLSKRCGEIHKWVVQNGKPVTDRQIMLGMGYTDMNSVRPRITELVCSGDLFEVGNVVCPITRKTVRLVSAERAQ